MRERNSVEIRQGSATFVGFAQEIYALIEEEAKRGNMLAKDVDDIVLEIFKGNSFLAFFGSELVGYIAVFPWHYHMLVEICSFIVKEQYRDQGIGTMLAEKAYGLAKQFYPESRVVALAHDSSRGIFSKQGFIYLPKCCLPKELWDICPKCNAYGQLPSCHCKGMIEQQGDAKYQLCQLTSKSEYITGTAKVYCEVWKEHPWNEHFWTAEGVTADIQKELTKNNACGYAMLNGIKVVSFSWGYEVSRDGLAEISGSHKLDMIFEDDKKIFYVDELGTLSGHRRQSLGKNISWQLLASVEEKGFDLAILRTEAEANAAQALYKKLGFKELPVLDEKHRSRSYWVLDLKSSNYEVPHPTTNFH